MWWTVRGSVSRAFFPDFQGVGEACSYSPFPCSELGWAQAKGESTFVPEQFSGPSEPEKGRAGSLGRELVAGVVEDASGELGLSGEPTEPTQPLSGGPRANPVPCSQSQERDFSKLAYVYPPTDSLSPPCWLPLTSALLGHSLTPTPNLTPHLSCPTPPPALLLPHPHLGIFLNFLSQPLTPKHPSGPIQWLPSPDLRLHLPTLTFTFPKKEAPA